MPKYSQVFLKDRAMCERIASELRPGDFDLALEIGPGRGALTEFLYPLWGNRLSLVEIDPALAAPARKKYPSAGVYTEDFLQFDLGANLPAGARAAFIGNLPYQCATAILLKTLAFPGFAAAVFMFQKEVAWKIGASAGDSDYGYLSVAVQVQSEVRHLSDVPAASFTPAPEVDSSVLVFSPRRAFGGTAQREAFLEFVKDAFSHRRKTLANSLALGMRRDRDSVKNMIETAGFNPRTRPQKLSVPDYLKLAAAFGERK